jgi:pSer/pThr/pTyr-binding forkhead associated (FHA) protein
VKDEGTGYETTQRRPNRRRSHLGGEPAIVRPEATTTIGADRDDEVLACDAGGGSVPCDARSH